MSPGVDRVEAVQSYESGFSMKLGQLGRILGLTTLFLLPLWARAADAQCAKDSDCKGDRICEAGACVNPVPPATASSSPGATPGPAAPGTPSGPGNGFQLEFGLFQVSGFANLETAAFTLAAGPSGTSTSPNGAVAAPQPLVSIGYQWQGNVLFLGAGFASTETTTVGNLLFDIGPAYRRYFSPLTTGDFSTFIEVGAAFAIYPGSGSSTGSSSSGSSDSVFGISGDVGIGSEWLFSRRFGLLGKVTLDYVHYNSTAINTDAVGLATDVVLVAHL